MPELLPKPKHATQRRCFPSTEEQQSDHVPKVSDPKELFAASRRLASLESLTPNLSRAVVQCVQNLQAWRWNEHACSLTVLFVDDVIYTSLGDAPLPERRNEDFLDRARRVEDIGRTDSALDVIYNHVDDMLLAGKFLDIDARLASTDCDKYSVDLLLALLTITYAAKSRLPHRSDFFARAEKSIRDRGALEGGLLYGLE